MTTSPGGYRRLISLAICLLALLCPVSPAQRPWPLWQHYTQHFLDPSGRIVDHTVQDRTTSEAQAYALFFALVDNDKPLFATILAWTEANLAGGDLTQHLPAWHWGRSPDGAWKVLDPNPAADADLWLAYTLLQAGRLWHNPRYERLGTLIAERIIHEEVALTPGLGPTLLPAPQGFHPDATTWILNTSYLPLPLLTSFARRFPDSPWPAILQSLHLLLDQGSGAGFVMDWVSVGNTVRPAVAPNAEPAISVGSYEAIRVYLWLGLADPATPGLPDLLKNAKGMAAYLHLAPIPPRIVDATGRILDTAAPPGFIAAVIPYLHALHLQSEQMAQQARLDALLDPATGLYGSAYYDQNLALFAAGWSEQRFRFDRKGFLIPEWRESNPSPHSSPRTSGGRSKNAL